MSVPVEAINFLFERPTEPVFNRKGTDGSVQFVIPSSYYTDRYKNITAQIGTRFDSTPASQVYNIKELTNIPDISLAQALPMKSHFSVFNEFHRDCANRLIDLFMDQKNVEDFVSLSTYCHDRVNPYMFQYALSVALLHRPDTKNYSIPSYLSSFPEIFVDKSVFYQAREEANIVPTGSRMSIEVPRDYTASDLDLEHAVAYFREDIGVNLHHWHWHLVYPFNGRPEIVNKDRRGELFYYMHHQLLARYNMERLCNRLGRVRRLTDLREAIEEGYYPKLDNYVAARMWPSRHPNSIVRNVNREEQRTQVDIQDLERYRDRIFEAVQSGRYLPLGSSQTQPFTTETGINMLGNMIEASNASPNRQYYGSLHNDGHNLISFIHDPDNQYLELAGVMGDSATAMRDPVFYRWHAYIDHIFVRYKDTLTPYTVQELSFDKVSVTGISLRSTGVNVDNELYTFWQQADIDLSRGLDFAEQRGSVFGRVTHLQHAPFTYTITVQNAGAARNGTVRIFYAPKHDERNNTIDLRIQKNLFVELDRFVVSLKSGANTITRRSTESSVTIPYEQTFRNLSNRPAAGTAAEAAYNFCGCGWPHHMLIAKGTTSGYPCNLFVMVSNNANDRVQGANTTGNCDDASSYCGIRDSKYPDRQAMGFPFDRAPRTEVITLKQFLTPNMAVQDITIRYADRIVAPIQKQNS